MSLNTKETRLPSQRWKTPKIKSSIKEVATSPKVIEAVKEEVANVPKTVEADRPKTMTEKFEILQDLCEAFDNFSEPERKLNLFKYLGLFSRRDAIHDQY